MFSHWFSDRDTDLVNHKFTQQVCNLFGTHLQKYEYRIIEGRIGKIRTHTMKSWARKIALGMDKK